MLNCPNGHVGNMVPLILPGIRTYGWLLITFLIGVLGEEENLAGYLLVCTVLLQHLIPLIHTPDAED